MRDSNTADVAGHAVHAVEAHDDVATALRALAPGEQIDTPAGPITLIGAVPNGHKVAMRSVAAGAGVRKYGWPIGRATRAIAPGEHVHVHNVETMLGDLLDYRYQPSTVATAAAAVSSRTFRGYRRADGRVGTRNEIWILCTVGCVANTARRIAEQANARFVGRVEGVFAFPHPFGCSQLGGDLDQTRRLLASLASHPNAGGVLVVGLGCENNQLEAMLSEIDVADPARLMSFAAQMVEDELADGLAAVEALVRLAETDQRSDCPLSDLVLGLKCGGSDGFSGITANPLVGRMADALADAGGTPVLTEIPEIFGAEQVLMDRAADASVFAGIGTLVDDFKRYFLDHGQQVHENPSPGNIAGGITTLEEKSLGAVQKAGRAPVVDVLRYGERVRTHGLTLLEAPGNDAVSSTALAAAGATVILFTTGRGTPMGFPAPTIKIASNSTLAARKPGWIDFDAGAVLSEGDAVADRLLDLVVATASGQSTCSERNGEREIAIWKRGVTL
ncbi:altronate dehydratase family protein [Sphingomonas sp.]|jgi:altronate hydrolase|uniref:UxaA family hydrolase n=1 Tax=Sphingomonas sp. TaxID=28214 RepID=UPI002EDADA8A